jgi:hypothetical protein
MLNQKKKGCKASNYGNIGIIRHFRYKGVMIQQAGRINNRQEVGNASVPTAMATGEEPIRFFE